MYGNSVCAKPYQKQEETVQALVRISKESVQKCIETLELGGCRSKYQKLLELSEKAPGGIHLHGTLEIIEGGSVPFFTLKWPWMCEMWGIPNQIRAVALDAVMGKDGWERPCRKHWE